MSPNSLKAMLCHARQIPAQGAIRKHIVRIGCTFRCFGIGTGMWQLSQLHLPNTVQSRFHSQCILSLITQSSSIISFACTCFDFALNSCFLFDQSCGTHPQNSSLWSIPHPPTCQQNSIESQTTTIAHERTECAQQILFIKSLTTLFNRRHIIVSSMYYISNYY